MKVLVHGRWIDGVLDYHRQTGEERVQVLEFRNLSRLEDLYFVRKRSLRLVWNYLKEVGPQEVFRKIVSRQKEGRRNEKFFSYGIGRIVESDDDTRVGLFVGFLATSHPACCERVVVPKELTVVLDSPKDHLESVDHIRYQPTSDAAGIDTELDHLRGWSAYAGESVSQMGASLQHVLKRMSLEKKEAKPISLSIARPSKIQEVSDAVGNGSDTRKRAVLFGYGNYAKTVVIPSVAKYLRVDRIHEIDPLQMDPGIKTVTWDSSPEWRSTEHHDVALIAGFHHTHAPLAITALSNNMDVVVEKPVVVDEDQLEQLLATMASSQARLFSCFHKRYSTFNDYAIRDLGVSAGDPISYHCIVYEVPLPESHWYRWPNSRSRLVSNGCHWIDHFLYLNGFAEVDETSLVMARDGTINCTITLSNDAFFSMTLTDKGSERIGVQDYIELRVGRVTVKLTNSAKYLAEDDTIVIRSIRENRLRSHRDMYSRICRAIARGEAGDSIETVRVSSGAVLRLEAELMHTLPSGAGQQAAIVSRRSETDPLRRTGC